MSNITKFVKPKCPYCGRGDIHEYDTCILDGSGSEVIIEGKVREVGVSQSEADLEKAGYYDAIYQGGNDFVGVMVDYSKDPNGTLPCEIEAAEYRCTRCGAVFSTPYELSAALEEAAEEEQNQDYD